MLRDHKLIAFVLQFSQKYLSVTITISTKFLLPSLFFSPFSHFFHRVWNCSLNFLLFILIFLFNNFSHLSQSPYWSSFIAGAVMWFSASQFSKVLILMLFFCVVKCLWDQFITANPISLSILFFPLFSLLYFMHAFSLVFPIVKNHCLLVVFLLLSLILSITDSRKVLKMQNIGRCEVIML